MSNRLSPAMIATRNNATSIPTLRVIGLMSGTSLDGCDAVLTEISPRGSSVHINTLAFITHPMPTTLRERIVACLKPENSRMDELARLDSLLSHWFVEAVDALLATTSFTREDIDLIGSHGQTMWHDVNLHLHAPEKVRERMTWQLGDGSFIAALTGITTVCDFRTADVAIGGQGAPLIPFFDHLLYSVPTTMGLSLSLPKSLAISPSHSHSHTLSQNKGMTLFIVALQNIGGIGNVTLLPSSHDSQSQSQTHSLPVLGFDTGPGNMVIDRFVELATNGNAFYDCNGDIAAQGKVHESLLQAWMTQTTGSSEFFQQFPPKSTGREQFGHDYADLRWQEATVVYGLSTQDAIATATALTARSIVLSYEQGLQVILKSLQEKERVRKTETDRETDRESAEVTIDCFKVIVAGGGAHNKTLLTMIESMVKDSTICPFFVKYVRQVQVLCAGEKKNETSNSDDLIVSISADAKEATAFAVLAYQSVCGRRNHLPITTGGSREVRLGKICPGDNFYQVLLSAQPRHYCPPSVASAAPSASSLPTTESRLAVSEQIDRLSAVEIVDLINCEDTHVSRVVASLRESIATVAEMIAESITGCCGDERDESNTAEIEEKDEIKGRVFYFGAGTSGRLGVLDASEIPPTFSAPREWFQGVIAGGDIALRSAVEGAEDNVSQGELDLLALGVTARDIVIGIASSGTTPYVHGALRAAKEKVHVRQTVLITCNPPPSVSSSSIAPIGPWTYIDTVIPAVVGPEVLTGSTRMKAGTATKLILNQLSTVAMILAGKSLGNLMVDLRMSNEKLKRRAVRILRTVIVGMNEEDAKDLLIAADGKVKLAIAMYLISRVKKEHCDSDRVIYSEDDKKYAEDVLKSCHGRLAAVIQKFA